MKRDLTTSIKENGTESVKENIYSKPAATNYFNNVTLDKEQYQTLTSNKFVNLTFIPDVKTLKTDQDLVVLEEDDLYDILQDLPKAYGNKGKLTKDASRDIIEDLRYKLKEISLELKRSERGPINALQHAVGVTQKFIDLCNKSARYNEFARLVEEKRKEKK